MNIYIGEKFVAGVFPTLDKKTVLHRAKKILISSMTPPCIEVSLGEGRVLFMFGHIYGTRESDGAYSKFDISGAGKSVLRNMINRLKLNDFIKRIEGHFIGVLINSVNEIVIFADIYNRKDIFYVSKSNTLILSTDLNAVMSVHPSKNYNQAALVSIFSIYGMSPPKKHTIYEGVYRLGVGERVEYKDGKVAVKSFPFEPESMQDYGEDKLHEYSRIMHSAVEVRSSVECNWVYLSSGWDSSAILAILAKLHGHSKVRALIMRSKYSKKVGITNQIEIERAKKIAGYFSVPLEILDVDYTKQEYVNYWDEIRGPLKANQLFMLINYNFFRLAQHAARNGSPSHAVFNGEISDGAHNLGFSQFNTVLDHPDLNFREYSDKMAAYLFGPSFYSCIVRRKPGKDFVYNILRSHMADCIFDDPKGMSVRQRKAKFIGSFFLSSKRIPFFSLSNSKVLTLTGKEEFESCMYDAYFKDFVKKVTPDTLYSWLLHLYNSFHWQGGAVKGLTQALDHYKMKISMPYWDSRLQSFLSAMPESWGRGLDLNPTKYPLKWMLKNKVDYPFHFQVGPHSYLYDINPNWNGYADILYGSAGKPYFKKIIKGYPFEGILQKSHFNLNYLRKLTDDYIDDNETSGQELTDLTNLISLSLVGWF